MTVLQGIREALPGVSVTHAQGASISKKWGLLEKEPSPLGDPLAEMREAVAAAAKADVVILCVGTDSSIEGEGKDRRSLSLPGNQDELVTKVLEANPRTIVIQMSAGPLTTPWIKEHARVILQAWWPGGEGGHAISDILLGKFNPAGRLPYTVYASDSQVPPRNEYDISKGWTYMFLKGDPLWPFGHGLSYTSFTYSDLKTAPADLRPDGALRVEFDVTNAGKLDGEEVSQVYVQPPEDSGPIPSKELRGFLRYPLTAGEKRHLSFDIPASKMARWDEKAKAFRVYPGNYRLMVGASSADIRLNGEFRIKAP